jgi:integrase
MGQREVTAVTRRDVKALIARKAEIAPVSAGALLGYVRRLLQYAVELEHIEINPAADLRPPARARQRQRNLSPDEIRQFWRVLPSLDASEHVRLVLRFALLTGQRIGEILQLRWTDIEGDWWTVPAAVSKNRLAHRVYLTPMAKELLEQARAGADGGDLVWRGKAKRRPGQTAPDYALDRCAPMHVINRGLAAVDEAGVRRLTLEPFRVHDLRRTAASQMAAIGIPRDIISKVLNHAERGVTAVYDRYSYDAEKMDAASRWADALRRIVDGEGAPTAPDVRTLEARLALCEAQYVAAPR